MRIMKLSCESRAGAIKMSEMVENSTASRRPDFDKVHYYYYYSGGTLFKKYGHRRICLSNSGRLC